MIARVLEYEEWHRIDASLDPILVELRPGTSRICVVEDEGEIVARWILMPILHAECIWIAPHKRKTGRVGAKLLRLMKSTARALGFSVVMTASDSEEVTKLLAHVGATPVPCLPFVMSVKEGT